MEAKYDFVRLWSY